MNKEINNYLNLGAIVKQKFGQYYIRAGNKRVILIRTNQESNEIILKLMRKNHFYNKYRNNLHRDS